MGQISDFDNFEDDNYIDDEIDLEDEYEETSDEFENDRIYKNTIIIIDKNKKIKITSSSFKYITVNKKKILTLYSL